MNGELSQVSVYLNSKGITIPSNNEWLSACVECFKSQSSRYTLSNLQTFVYDQWLLADLNDVKAGTLPSTINSNKIILSGSYAVQFNYVVNVSVPFYKQLELLRRPDSQKNLEADGENVNKEVSHRSLKIELTDGLTTLIGFEDQFIPCIKDLVPGSKAVLKGPIEVRKGILMLKANNVTMLGGEVDTLLICNATENVLARFLNQPENDDPYKHLSKEPEYSTGIDDDDLIIMAVDELEPVNTKRLKTENQSQRQKPKTKQPSITTFTSIQKPQIDNFEIPTDMFEDDFELPDDMIKLEAQSLSNTRNHQDSFPVSSSHNNLKDKAAKLKTELAKSYNENWIPPPQKSSLEAPRPSHEKGKILVDLLDEPLNLEDFDADFEIEKTPKRRITPDFNFEEPFPPKSYPSTRKVIAKVVKVSKKLNVKDGNWALSCLVLAKGVEMEMDFSSQVLEKLIGVSVEEITSMRKEVKNDIVKKNQINDMLKNKQQTIKNLNCNMSIKFLNFISNPIVIDIHDA